MDQPVHDQASPPSGKLEPRLASAGYNTSGPQPGTPTELETYNVFRDYIKHEDGLLNARLTSFLSMNTFMIAASVLILGGMLNAFAKMDLHSTRLLVLLAFGTAVHSILAYIGRDAAQLTASSIQAATDALAELRDKGNTKLAEAIARGDFPHMTNARSLTEDEKKSLDKGSGIMRGIPRHMENMWLLIGAVPVLILILVAVVHFHVIRTSSDSDSATKFHILTPSGATRGTPALPGVDRRPPLGSNVRDATSGSLP